MSNLPSAVKFLASLAAALLMAAPLATAAEGPVAIQFMPSDPPATVASIAPRPSVVTAIRRAEAELKGRLAELKKVGALTERLGFNPGSVDVTLAVWNRETDAIRYLLVHKYGDELTLREGDKPMPRVTVSARQNSQFEYPDRSEVVVGAIYPVAKAVKLYSGRYAYDIKQTFVVPSGRDTSGPEVIAAGSNYLSGRIQLALDDLRDLGIKSAAYPDRLLADVADPYLIKSIVIIEHSSHIALLADIKPEKEMGDFLEYLGRRGDDAFDATTSSAGATGMAQFIPSTYNLLVKQHPELKLIKDFKTGMANHHNALKAEIFYLDECLADMPKSVRDSVRLDPLAAATVMAAAYNGGSTRIRRAIANWGLEAWSGTKALKAGALYSETYWYVAKLKAVYAMLQNGYYATPTAPANALPLAPATAAGNTDGILATVLPGPLGTSMRICFDGDVCH